MLAHRRPQDQWRRLARWPAVLLLITLAGCVPQRADPPVVAPAADIATRVPAGSIAYELEATRCEVLVLVFRAGPLARLGHNHVLRATALEGRVWEGRDAAGSGFAIEVPVAALAVDEPASRAAAGVGFESEVSDDARAGTQSNLLRPEVLDAARHPVVRIESRSMTGPRDRPTVRAVVTLRGASVALDVPVQVSRQGDDLEVVGRLALRQSDFGIVPFSIAGGAVQVADDVEVRFRLVARRL